MRRMLLPFAVETDRPRELLTTPHLCDPSSMVTRSSRKRGMMKDTAARLEAAILDPASVFRSPDQVEHDPTLGRDDKLAILRSWEEDARELAVAEEENMAGGEPSRLDEVVAARGRVERSIESAAQGQDASLLPIRHFARPVRETIHADHEIDEALVRLSLQQCPVLPVIDGDEIVGIIGEADLVRARAEGGPARLTARHLMTTEVPFCYLDDALKVAHELMDRRGCDHLLVVDGERALAGVLGREALPSGSKAEPHAMQDRPDVVESRNEKAQGIGTKTQPGGLEVYAERPIIKKVPRS